jgi:hypothetical protein
MQLTLLIGAVFWGVTGPLCRSSTLVPFSNYYFLVRHLVNRDERHLLPLDNGL